MMAGERILITGGSGFIGTNAINACRERGDSILNFDINPPRAMDQQEYWRQGDVRNNVALEETCATFSPTRILHLAAMTGMDVNDPSVFDTNTLGVSNLIAAAKHTNTVRSVVFTSSLLVCRNGYVPKNDQDFCPPNLYGESKVEGERLIRAAGDLPFEWKVVRPTSVWGPWFEHSYRSFFRMVSMGLYVHPGATPIHKPLTFVGNTVQTMLRLLTTPSDDDVYYLVDYPQRSIQEWANTIRLQINNKRVRTAPVSLLRFGAVAGDILKALTRRDMPLTSFRLNNMLTGGSYPIDNTKALVGPLPYTMEQGVDRTLSWMRATKQIG